MRKFYQRDRQGLAKIFLNRVHCQEMYQEKYYDYFCSQPPVSMKRGLDFLASADLSEDLRRIESPVMLVHGGGDEVIPSESSLSMASMISDSRCEIIVDCGHDVVYQSLPELEAKISSFLLECS